MSAARKILSSMYYRFMTPIWNKQFEPRIVSVDLPGCSYVFFIANSMAAEWYDPPKPYTLTEYEWVLANIDFANQRIIDAGAHHGHYTLLFSMAKNKPDELIAIEPLAGNCAIIKVNAALNSTSINLIQVAISEKSGKGNLLPRSNAKLHSSLGREVQTITLPQALDDPTIVKIDIEGEEFNLFPGIIDDLPTVHTWIIEIHQQHGDQDKFVRDFLSRGYRINYLDRNICSVVTYTIDSKIPYSTTFFFRKD